ncbi:MAG: hypothetical protein AB2693_22055 [Candidatus Thiodiazotropha sp.]
MKGINMVLLGLNFFRNFADKFCHLLFGAFGVNRIVFTFCKGKSLLQWRGGLPFLFQGSFRLGSPSSSVG